MGCEAGGRDGGGRRKGGYVFQATGCTDLAISWRRGSTQRRSSIARRGVVGGLFDCSKFLDWLGSPQVTSGSSLGDCDSMEACQRLVNSPLTGGRFEDDTNRSRRSYCQELWSDYMIALHPIYAFDLSMSVLNANNLALLLLSHSLLHILGCQISWTPD